MHLYSIKNEILYRTMYQFSATYNDKTNEMSYLQAQIQAVQGCVNGLKKNRNQQQEEEEEEEIQNKSYTSMECVFIQMTGYYTIHNNYSYAKTS